MFKPHDFFISHSSNDNQLARDLKAALLEIKPDWDVFLDCDETRPLEPENEWRRSMLDHAQNSRYLIFLASDPTYLKKGHGWLYEEVSTFHGRCATRFRDNRADRTIEYFGIIFGEINFQMDLYSSSQGSEYFSLYNFRQHILLNRDDTIQSAFSRIKAKVLNMEKQEHDLSAELLDKVLDYTHRRQRKDEMFSTEAIDELLLPNLLSADPPSEEEVPGSFEEICGKLEVSISFEEFCSKLKNTHAVVLGEQGGCGKTTLMTRLFFHHLHAAKIDEPDTMIPIFIDARALTGKDHLILRHMAEILYQDHTAKGSEYTGEYVTKLSGEFRRENEHPRYLLLIDGCNELPDDSLRKFNKELRTYCEDGGYPNVRLVLSGRTLDQFVLLADCFCKISIEKLYRQQVFAYLEQFQPTHEHVRHFLREVRLNDIMEIRGAHKRKRVEAMMETLQIPLFSKLFVETTDTDQIQTRGELMRQYMLHQDRSFSASDADEDVIAFNSLCLQHILPVISHSMTSGDTASAYTFGKKELRSMIKKATALMFEEDYRDYYQKEYRDRLKKGLPSMDAMEIADQFTDHMLNHSKLLRVNENDTYEFIHQIYRDFFCAYYISEDIKRGIANQTICNSVQSQLIDPDLRGFVAELLGENGNIFDPDTGNAGSSASILLQTLDVARKNLHQDSSYCVANVITLLRTGWQNDLSGIDLSHLDLTKSNLRTCVLSKMTENGLLTSNFRGSSIHVENLLDLNHGHPIEAACAGKNYIATYDRCGTIMLWDRVARSGVPFKIIDETNFQFSKILFAPDEKSLYAMADDRILEIAIPETYRSEAVCKVLLKTEKRFWDIKLNDQGELLFSTAMNPFNFKSVLQPDQPDRWNFTVANSCAAIRDDESCLAFSFTAYANGMKLYDRDPGTNDWKERKFGYSALLDRYIHSMEDALKDFGVYSCFASAQETDSVCSRLQFFEQLQENAEFENRCSAKALAKIQDFVLRKLTKLGVSLDQDQIGRLDQLRSDIQDALLAEYEKHAVLLNISRRHIRSLSWKRGRDILLVAYSQQHATEDGAADTNKELWTNKVIELNTKTMQIHPIAEYISSRSVRFSACYSHDCIIVNQSGNVDIYDWHGGFSMRIGYRRSNIGSFVFLGEDDDVCAVSLENIYRFDKNNRCTAAWYNDLDDLNLVYCENDDGDRCLVSKRCFERAGNQNRISALKLKRGSFGKLSRRDIGQYRVIDFSDKNEGAPMNSIRQGRRAYQYNAGKILCYTDDERTAEINACYKLFICGCDFREIRGSLSSPEYLRLLNQYGAQTDAFPRGEYAAPPEIPQFLPSQVPFLPGWHSFRKTIITEVREDCKRNFFWGKIQKTMTESTYSILEWIGALGVASPEIICRLMNAGLICKFRNRKVTMYNVDSYMNYAQKYGLIYRAVSLSHDRPGTEQMYALTQYGGEEVLCQSTKIFRSEKSNIPRGKSNTSKSKDDISKKIRTNRWFSMTAERYAQHITDHALYNIFDSKLRMSARGRINGYLKLGEQAFFAEPVLELRSEDEIHQIKNKALRLGTLAVCHRQLIRYGNRERNQVSLSRVPILIFLCSDFDHCRSVNAHIASVFPEVRKLYTYDALLEGKYKGPVYFEFVDDEPYAVDLLDLIQAAPANQSDKE